MCKVRPALPAKAWKNSRTSCASKAPNSFGREFGAEHEKRPPRHVERDAGQRLVHRQEAVGVAGQTLLVAERHGEGLPQGNADVLDRVVVVNMSVALGADGEINQGMARELVEHMVEEPDPGRNVGNARPVEIEADLDARLLGFACDRTLAHGESRARETFGGVIASPEVICHPQNAPVPAATGEALPKSQSKGLPMEPLLTSAPDRTAYFLSEHVSARRAG